MQSLTIHTNLLMIAGVASLGILVLCIALSLILVVRLTGTPFGVASEGVATVIRALRGRRHRDDEKDSGI